MADFLTGIIMVFYVLLYDPSVVAVDHQPQQLYSQPESGYQR
jgi:hypothetical protein